MKRRLLSSRFGMLATVTVALLGLTAPITAASASAAVPSTARSVHLTPFEQRLLSLINHDRTVRKLRPLTITPCAEDFARSWTQKMAKANKLAHNPHLAAMWSAPNCRDASKVAENIGKSSNNADVLYVAYMHSPEHRANILDPKLRFVGIGSWMRTDGTVYNTIDFSNGASPKYTKVKRLGQGLQTP